jgi:hypothetical protein
MAGAVHVRGIGELQRAFRRADRRLSSDLDDVLAEAAAPVRTDAQRLAAGAIRRAGAKDPWARMRVGVHRSVAYVAPVERNKGGPRRRKFGTRLMDEAMNPALERNRAHVDRRFDHLLDEVTNAWTRG